MKLLNDILDFNSTSIVLFDEIELEYLIEAKEEKEQTERLYNFDHAEDCLIRGCGKGFDDMLTNLTMTHEFLSGGRKRPGFNISTKMDGSPSIVWGHDPNSSKFFVGTKAFFNRTPKVNYTDKDIDANHGSSPTLAARLKMLLKHLKSVTPRKGVFQGDLMYTGQEVTDYNNKLTFTPNTLTYSVDKNSGDGRKILKSKVGIAPHTEYEQMPNGNLQAKFDIDLSQFKKNDDVHLFDTKVSGPFHYPATQKKEFVDNIKKVMELQFKLNSNPENKEILKSHEKLLLAYINAAVKTKKDNSLEGYIAFLNRQFAKRVENVKQDKTKQTIRQDLNQELQNIVANKSVFKTLFQAHKHVQQAKDILVKTLSHNSPYKETILGVPSKPEGFVVSNNNKPMKLVDRQHFSAANFEWNERANPDHNPVVMSWGKMNPAHAGHGKVLAKGADIARRTGAKHVAMTTNNKDKTDKDNPLTAADKVKWLKSMFPGQEVALAGRENSTIVAQLQQLHNKGTKDVTIVAGADRVKDYTNILAKHNGPGKLFHFHKARVVSSGERDPDSDGTEGLSSSKVRNAAKYNDYNKFKVAMPSHIEDHHAKELFHSLQVAMKNVKIGSDTPNHSLSIYGRRLFGDKTGDEARAEIKRRKLEKETTQHAKQ